MKEKSNNRQLISFLIFGLLIIVAVLTNPNENLHKSKVKKLFYSQMENELDKGLKSNNKWADAGSAIGISVGMAFTDKLIDNIVTVDNYVVFSFTNISWKGNQKTIGYGLFGNVIILDDAKKLLRK